MQNQPERASVPSYNSPSAVDIITCYVVPSPEGDALRCVLMPGGGYPIGLVPKHQLKQLLDVSAPLWMPRVEISGSLEYGEFIPPHTALGFSVQDSNIEHMWLHLVFDTVTPDIEDNSEEYLEYSMHMKDHFRHMISITDFLLENIVEGREA